MARLFEEVIATGISLKLIFACVQADDYSVDCSRLVRDCGVAPERAARIMYDMECVLCAKTICLLEAANVLISAASLYAASIMPMTLHTRRK